MNSEILTDAARLEYISSIIDYSKLHPQERYLDKLGLYTLEITENADITQTIFHLTENFSNKRILQIQGLSPDLLGVRYRYRGNTKRVLGVCKEYIYRSKNPNQDSPGIESLMRSEEISEDNLIDFDTGIIAVYRGIIHFIIKESA